MANPCELEKTVERRLRDRVEQSGGRCLKWVCPGRSGVPDRLVLLPGGAVWFVETKRPKGGRLSPLQIWWRDRLRALGFTFLVVATPEDLARFNSKLQNYLLKLEV